MQPQYMKFMDEKNHWRELSGVIVCGRSDVYLRALINKVSDYAPQTVSELGPDPSQRNEQPKERRLTTTELLRRSSAHRKDTSQQCRTHSP